jgi:hypothetical protein
LPLISLGDEIPAGMAYLSEELGKGRSACWVGRGPAGFALLTATARPRDLPRGVVVAISLTPALLRKLQARITELLDESEPPPIDGIKLGEPIGGGH